MKISFIVSAYNRPQSLKLCLQSLILQTEKDWEAIVTDNSPYSAANFSIVKEFGDSRIIYLHANSEHCYYSADIGVTVARGDWLAFPCDDTYYTPSFAQKMLYAAETGLGCDRCAGDKEGPLDIVCCDFVWGRQNTWTYCDGAPQVCHINKATFLIRKEKMRPFPRKDEMPLPMCDGWLAEEIVAEGGKVGRVTEILVCTN